MDVERMNQRRHFPDGRAGYRRREKGFGNSGGDHVGHRANFVVIRNGEARAYYDNWAAMGCIFSFAAGPDEATESVSQYEPTNELMDWASAEGGYLIDFDEKKAIVFGCPVDLDEFAELGEGADSSFLQGGLAFLQRIGPNWIGWELVWDDHGVDAFAAHLRKRSIGNPTVQPDSHPPETSGPIEFRP
jgi:hypothetical protein